MSEIHATALVDAKAQIGDEADIGPYCVVGPDVRVGANTRLIAHVVVDGHTTIGADCTVFPFACVGTQTQDLKFEGGTAFVEIGDGTTLREYVTVNAGTFEGECTRVGSGCHIMAYSHVAHACTIGNDVIIANATQLAGEVVVEDQARLGGLVGVHQFCRIGRLCMVGHNAKISQDVPPFVLADGNPVAIRGVNTIGMERAGIEAGTRAVLKNAYKLLYRQGLSTVQALETIEKDLSACPELEHLLAFVRGSERGIVK